MGNHDILDKAFMAEVSSKLASAERLRSELDKELEALAKRKEIADLQVVSLKAVLKLGNLESSDSGASSARSSPSSGSKPSESLLASVGVGRVATADDVVKLLIEKGEPMHYKAIHAEFVDRGFEIGGRGNADTLLARYFKDPRLERVARGTYAVKAARGQQE